MVFEALSAAQIWTLPKLSIVFSVPLASALDSVLVDSGDGPALSLPGDSPRKQQELDIEQVLVAPLGETSPQPHLLVRYSSDYIHVRSLMYVQLFLRSGQLAIYQALPIRASVVQGKPSRASLAVRFAKVATRILEVQRHDDAEKTVLAEQKKISRALISFVTSPSSATTLFGVFFTGDRPCWILKTDHSGIKMHPSGHSVVHAFTACSLWESKGDFLLYSDEVNIHHC
jgi:cleavage and polyadenylation specificity factor subunit 1